MAIRYREGRPSPYQVYWNNPFTGKRESASFATEEEAKKEESLIKHRLQFDRDSFKKEEEEESDTPESSELTFGDVYLLYLKDRQFDAEAIVRSRWTAKRALEYFKATPIAQITKKDLKGFLETLLKSDLTSASIHRYFCTVKTVFNFAIEQEYCEHVIFPKLPSIKYEQFIPPTQEEITKLLEVAPPHIQRVIIFGSQFGMRIGPCELFRLTWEDVDLDKMVLRIHGSKKNKAALWREVPIKPSLVPILEAWKAEDMEQGVTYLISYSKKPVTNIRKVWHRLLKKVGITRRIRPYDLRHAFATEAIAAGGDIGTVAKLMGHANANMILKHYQYIKDRQKEETIAKLPDPTYVPNKMCPKGKTPKGPEK